jgi:hypothetical protein
MVDTMFEMIDRSLMADGTYRLPDPLTGTHKLFFHHSNDALILQKGQLLLNVILIYR